MNCLEGVPFKTLLGSLVEPLREMELVTAPEITIPDYLHTLQNTEYEFTLENWVLTGLQGGYPSETQQTPPPPCGGGTPSCPPYWLMFRSPQENRLASRQSSDLWAPDVRPRSHSLSSADVRRRRASIRFVGSNSEDEAGYSEDDEGSSTDDNRPRRPRTEMPRSTSLKNPLSRLKDLHRGPSSQHSSPGSPCGQGRHKRATLTTLQDSRQASLSTLERSHSNSPLLHGQRQSRKRQPSQSSMGRKTSLPLNLPCSCPCLCSSPSRPQQQRPSSAGPIVKNHRNRALRPRSFHGLMLDSSAELLTALSQEERELLEAITEQGYPLRTAILALQKTGYSSTEKILNYLVASDRLCEQGYDEAQIEEALEMFQNCESKAAEFLRLLTQFNEMGFQQSAIKEVLLIHENHRERALEELMTRVA